LEKRTPSPLVLGGHSFIGQLGNDPPATDAEQREIVETCLDRGIAWFDTTYMPERIALGRTIQALDRRDEAFILAWNFFTDFGPGDAVGKPEPYRPGHIDAILEQLRTDYVDILVVVPSGSAEENQRQQALACAWQKKGYVRALGLWVEDPGAMQWLDGQHPYRFAIRPYNIKSTDAASVFAAHKQRGCETLATSPFFRGWELDRIVAAATRDHGDPASLRSSVADLMLRFAVFQPDIDRVIVAMRRVEWVARNLESVARGPLSAEELQRLQELRALAVKKRPWWRRWRRRS
jgi:aryl-alcohol dehydrogenase-like predicted oxidoreductase